MIMDDFFEYLDNVNNLLIRASSQTNIDNMRNLINEAKERLGKLLV